MEITTCFHQTPKKRVNVMTYENSERATSEISNRMKNLGEFMAAGNAAIKWMKAFGEPFVPSSPTTKRMKRDGASIRKQSRNTRRLPVASHC